ncbi:MAG: DUF748 domain-containing protein [Candidatus Omnitrophota bacterium]
MKIKVINIKGIAILAAVLLIFQLSFGFLISPFALKFISKCLNRHTAAKVSTGSLRFWPLTLSCSADNLKVFDPDNEKQRIASVGKASFRMSILGLLSKRFAISRMSLSDVEVNVKGEPDGSFNLGKIVPKDKKAKKSSVLQRSEVKRDWFNRVYEIVKERYSRKKAESNELKAKEKKKITRKVSDLPKGRRVNFYGFSPRNMFEARNISVKNVSIRLEDENSAVVYIKNAALYIKSLGFDSERGFKFDGAEVKGQIEKDGALAGSIELSYQNEVRDNKDTAKINITAADIDLPSVSFIYEDSLPVFVAKGSLDIKSQIAIINDTLDSNFTLRLKGHSLAPRAGGKISLGSTSLKVICDVINTIDPAEFSFNIKGKTDKPSMEGFNDSLKNLIKPYLTNYAGKIKEEGAGALKGILNKSNPSPLEKALPEEGLQKEDRGIESLKSIFGGK